MKRLRDMLAGALCAGLLGCGGTASTLELTILTPPGDDPFATADTVQMTLEQFQVGSSGAVTYNTEMSTSSSVKSDTFSVSFDVNSPSTTDLVRLTVVALAGGAVVGRGHSPNFILSSSATSLTIYVGRPGQVTATSAQLVNDNGQYGGRAGLSAVSLRGQEVVPPQGSLGAIITGGVDSTGATQASTLIYDPTVHQVRPTSGTSGTPDKPAVPRSGAVLVPSADSTLGEQAILWGGVAQGGAVLPTKAELFDAAQSDGARWLVPPAAVADPGGPGAVQPAVAEVQDETFLLCGGYDATGQIPQNQAVRAQRFPAPAGSADTSAQPGVQRIAPAMMAVGPMQAARGGHSATGVTLPGGAAAFLFGGLDAGDPGPVAELYTLNNSFAAAPLAPAAAGGTVPASRRGHVALALWSGTIGDPRTKVLIAGGYEGGDQTKVLASGFKVDVQAGTVEAVIPNALMFARQGASVSEVGGEFVVCGGWDGNMMPVPSCERLSRSTGALIGTAQMKTPRAGHVAVLLETDQLLLMGGRGTSGAPLQTIDIYTSAN